MVALLVGLFAVPVGQAPSVAFAGGFDSDSFRRVDGSENNLDHPDWGRAESAMVRLTTPLYSDDLDEPAGATRPSARAVSNAVHLQQAPQPNGKGASDLLWQWGQFVDHDLVLTPTEDPAEAFKIPVPTGDPAFDPHGVGNFELDFNRSRAFELGPREQGNLNTSYLDASMVYGSDLFRSIVLRALDDTGAMATSGRRNLPFNQQGFDNAPSASLKTFFLAGDIRANEQLGLTALHTIFLREHNRLIKRDGLLRKVLRRLPGHDGDEELNGELRYQLARILVAAEVQAITYREFLPLLLGSAGPSAYGGYDPNVNASISNEFATIAFRLGHTMVPSTLRRRRSNGEPIAHGDIALRDAFFAPEQLKNGGIVAILRGLSSGVCEDIDAGIVEDLRSFLFGPPGAGGLDLAALNIQRGRDHGLPAFNDLRRELGIAPALNFAAITSDQSAAASIESVYDDVEDVDAWVGLMVEDHASDGMVGPTTAALLVEQFTRTRDGDRFWYERVLSGRPLRFVEKRTLAKLLEAHTPIRSELGADAFRVGE